MAGTSLGVAKACAAKAGLSLDEYLSKRAAGLKWCWSCREWRSAMDGFSVDRTRADGRASRCHECVRVKVRISTKGRVSAFKGQSHTPATRARMSEAARNRPSNRLGKRHTLKARKRISEIVRERTPKGPACHSYKDGKLAERRGERLTAEYKRWRYDVYVRDGFACRHCGDARGGNLHAHHVKPFATHPELRLDVANGITLCEPCHKAVHAQRD